MSRYRGLLAVAVIVLGGCTVSKTYEVARYHEGQSPISAPVPATTFYAVTYVDAARQRHVLKETARVLAKGSAVGFRAGEGGKIYAFTWRETFLIQAPSDVVLMWRGTDVKERPHSNGLHEDPFAVALEHASKDPCAWHFNSNENPLSSRSISADSFSDDGGLQHIQTPTGTGGGK